MNNDIYNRVEGETVTDLSTMPTREEIEDVLRRDAEESARQHTPEAVRERHRDMYRLWERTIGRERLLRMNRRMGCRGDA